MSWYNPASWFGGGGQPSTGGIGGANQYGAAAIPSNYKLSPQDINASRQAITAQQAPQANLGPDPVQLANNVNNQAGYTAQANVGSGQGNVGGAAGGAGGTATNPAFMGLYQGAIGQLQNAYNGLFGANGAGGGQFDQAVGQAAGNIQKGYQAQANTLGANYAQAQNQMPWELVGRGANSSSWADNNLNYAQQQFQNSNQQLQSSEQKDLAGLQQQEAGIKGQYGGYLAGYNNPQYQAMLQNAPSYIQSEALNNALQQLGNLQYTQGSNTPISQAIGGLQQNPSYQDQGGANIQNALKALAGSPTTQAAQNQIAQGIYSNPSNPQSQGYWQNYWQQLQQPTPTR